MCEIAEAEAHLNGGNQWAEPTARIGEDDRRDFLYSSPEAEKRGEMGENTKEDATKRTMHSVVAFMEGRSGND